MNSPKVPLWLLVLIIGLPQFSETVYSPALTEIQKGLNTTASVCEYTLTLYLFAFSLGILFWGYFSDHHGRKPCLLGGLVIYIFGCLGCYFSTTALSLLLFRAVQGFGAGSCSVIGQSMCRDVFQGKERGKVYSVIGSALSVSPAIGPVIGGLLSQFQGWSFNFLFLIFLGTLIFSISLSLLPETSVKHQNPLVLSPLKFLSNLRILSFCFLMAGCNGIIFSYYSEGPFYMKNLLSLSPSLYGASFLMLAFSGGIGSYTSKIFHKTRTSLQIIDLSVKSLLLSCFLFFLVCLSQNVWIDLGCVMLVQFSIGMMVPNILSIALDDYQSCIGKASSFFGFLNYMMASCFNFGIGFLHNQTAWLMPLYFLCISFLMLLVFRKGFLKSS